MMTSYFNLLKYATTGIASPDMTYYDRMRASTLMGGKVQTLTGIPPLSFKSDGTPLISWSMKGNGSQQGTPTPDAPIMPEFVGVRTGNLFEGSDFSATVRNVNAVTSNQRIKFTGTADSNGGRLTPISNDIVLQAGTYVIKSFGVVNAQLFLTKKSDTSVYYRFDASSRSFTLNAATTFFIGFNAVQDATYDETVTVMLNSGSSSMPYEPFGYKIPITCAGQTVPVYLGQTQTVRRIKKLVLTGTETYQNYSYSSTYGVQVTFVLGTSYKRANGLCNIYPVSTQAGSTHCLWIGSGGGDKNLYFVSILSDMSMSDASEFKSWVAQQYSAGTPVAVWYVLASPTEGIINEPLYKIGDYCDTLTTDTPIPTAKGSNTLSVDTTVQPSEVSITGNIKPES